MKKLKLYVRETCPYCNKVRRFLDNHQIQVELADVSDPNNFKELMEIGGMDQVPMLSIDGKALYESSDIIKWFQDNNN